MDFDLRIIPINEIVLNSINFYDISEVRELAQDIKEHGLNLSIVVVQVSKNKYRLVSGGRRLKACERLGWKTIPAKILLNVNEDDEIKMIIDSNSSFTDY